MEKQFVTFEIAKALKKKGFDEPCLAFYNQFIEKNPVLPTMCFQENVKADTCYWVKKNGCNFGSPPDKYIAAPLYQQVQDWLRVNHKILINYVSNYSGTHYFIVASDSPDNINEVDVEDIHGNDYYVARTKAVEYALTLI